MFTFPGEARAMAFRRRRRNLDQLLDEYAEALLLASVGCSFTIVPAEAWGILKDQQERRELEALYALSQPPEEFLHR